MSNITSVIGDFLKSLKSKRVLTGILTIVFMAADRVQTLGDTAEAGVA